MSKSKLQFKTEIQQLLDLMIHSVYSNGEIFVRELVANAADAIDKARFLSVTQPDAARNWEIRISADKEAKTLTISDNGIGMTRDELIKNIGTIAYSGTKAFIEAVNKAKEAGKEAPPELIGQFGIGFYSAFIAADKVLVETRKSGTEEAWRWESDGKSDFTVSDGHRDDQGTTVTLFLKEDFQDFMDYWRVSSVIRKYSDYIAYPIRMKHMVKDGDKEKEEDSTLNTMKAIWLRPESEVKEEEYESFYQHISQDYGKPARRISYSAEGTSEFKALLFFASRMPFQFRFGEKNKKGVHLYVKRVFITDECPGLLPEYMGFVSGVVDSSDLPLNISREMLQNNPMVARINKALTGRILSELSKMLETEREKYENFYKEFGRMLKEGIHLDWANREKLQDLLLFQTMNNPAGKLVTLKEYVDAMPSSQKAVYYISGDSREALEQSPQLEMLRKQNFDVLFLLDPVDEFVFGEMGKYAEKELLSVSKGDVKFDDATQKELEEKTKKAAEEGKSFLECMKTALEDKVKEVRFSARLTESPCCLVSDEHDPTMNMQRILKAMDQNAPALKRILELNAENALIRGLKKLSEKDPKSDKLKEYAEMLYDQALIAEGGELPDPVRFAKRTASLMTDAVNLNLSAE